METLNYKVLEGTGYNGYILKDAPVKVMQFGEGNFLRAFIDWQLDLLNEQTDLAAGVTIIRPINTAFPPSLNTQDGLYTTIIRGLNERGEAVSESRIIRSVNNELNPWQDFASYLALARNPAIAFVFSNTTEAGISYHAGDRLDDKPPVSFPAKLTQLLLERFRHFNGAADKGWTIIPCELIDYNGEALKALVLRYAKEWQLPAAFRDWVETANTFCSTLVDRIVTGYPRDEAEKLEAELGYHDAFLDTAEYFWLFVIQGPQALAETLQQFEGGVLLVSHDRQLISQSCNRFWLIEDGRLSEWHDAEAMFERLREGTGPVVPEASKAASKAPSSASDDLLERLVALETLLEEDLARKPKHQKPQLQAQWRKEIEVIEAQL